MMEIATMVMASIAMTILGIGGITTTALATDQQNAVNGHITNTLNPNGSVQSTRSGLDIQNDIGGGGHLVTQSPNLGAPPQVVKCVGSSGFQQINGC